MDDGLGYYGGFAAIAPLLARVTQLRAADFAEEDLGFILPPDVLPGVTAAYGFPVFRADVPAPMIVIRGA